MKKILPRCIFDSTMTNRNAQLSKEIQMGVRTQEIVGQIRTADQAQEAIATLLTRFGTETAVERLVEDARFAHQTTEETANRVAGNLLTSLVVRKPGGYVDTPTRVSAFNDSFGVW